MPLVLLSTTYYHLKQRYGSDSGIPDSHTGTADTQWSCRLKELTLKADHPMGHGRLLFYGLYKQQLRKVSPSSVSPFPWEGIGHHVFWRNRGRTQILSHVSFFVQQVKDSEACRALLERWGLKEHQGSLGYQDQQAKKETLEKIWVRSLFQQGPG